MNGLNQQMAELREASKTKVPEERRAILDAGIVEVGNSGVAPGLSVGERAPDFELPDATGKLVKLSDLLRDGPVVVSFYRGEWCPYCNMELRALQSALPEIRAFGASLVAISPQSPDHSLSATEKNELEFSVLSDRNEDAIRSYRVGYSVPAPVKQTYVDMGRDLSEENEGGSWNLPIPGTFVIGQDGVVRAAHASADYYTRMEPADIVAALKTLNE